MSSINRNSVTIHGWMVSELGLSGKELICYAVIYGFSQDGESAFGGNLGFLTEWLGGTKRSALSVLDSLIDKGLVTNESIVVNNVSFDRYKCVQLDDDFNLVSSEGELFEQTGDIKIEAPKRKQNEIDFVKFAEFWNKTMVDNETNIPILSKITASRKSVLKARAREHGKGALMLAVQKVVKSSFLKGTNKKGFVATFDWVFSPENFVKIIEGNYDDKEMS